MSAAATARQARVQPSRRIPVPDNMRGQVELPATNFVVLPRAVIQAIISKCSAGLEKDILLILAMSSWGGSQNPDKTWNRPEWVALPAGDVVEMTENTVTEDGVEDAFERLVVRRLIERRKIGTTNHYRICTENFKTAPEREQRVLPRKPAGQAGSVQTVGPHEPLIILPGAKSRPFPLRDDLNFRCANKCDIPVSVMPKLLRGKDVYVEILRHGEEKEKRTGVSLSAQMIDNKTNSKNVRPRQQAPAPTDPDLTVDLAVMREFLNRWFRGRLGPVGDHTCRLALSARGTATDPELTLKFRELLKRTEAFGWGLVVTIIRDAGQAAAKANDQRSGLSAEDMTELEQFTARQKQRLKGS
jgi:hypothetical protein